RFTYHDEVTGAPVVEEAELARIASLVIPPAWTHVWICRDPAGYLQATGRDAKGRKQYRYHPDHRRKREAEKFADLVPFGEATGRWRARSPAAAPCRASCCSSGSTCGASGTRCAPRT